MPECRRCGRPLAPLSDRGYCSPACREAAAVEPLALNRRDAAKALGMSLSSFQRHVQPFVPVVYVGGLRLYPVRELKAWLEARSCEGGRAA